MLGEIPLDRVATVRAMDDGVNGEGIAIPGRTACHQRLSGALAPLGLRKAKEGACQGVMHRALASLVSPVDDGQVRAEFEDAPESPKAADVKALIPHRQHLRDHREP